jgi:hypothetical protein
MVVPHMLSIAGLLIDSNGHSYMSFYVLGASRDKAFRLPPFEAPSADL